MLKNRLGGWKSGRSVWGDRTSMSSRRAEGTCPPTSDLGRLIAKPRSRGAMPALGPVGGQAPRPQQSRAGGGRAGGRRNRSPRPRAGEGDLAGEGPL